jgi:tRNA pseudouridine55 synthase
MIHLLKDSMTQSTNGVLIINKPSGLTSHDVVHAVRRNVGQRSVGHLGTLDPMATGVLPIVLGNMTRLAQFYLKSEKSYQGVIRFGFPTDTYDSEGEPLREPQELRLSLEQLRELAASFRGVIEQIPPPFSAKKIQGVPAYKLARKKKEVPLQPVPVEIKEFELLNLENNCAGFRSRVASGTYIRSIAHEFGRLAGCGAHLQALCRTSVAEFSLAEAHTLDQLALAVQTGELESILVHPRKLLPSMPSVTASEDIASRIRHGQAVNVPELSRAPEVKVFYGQRELICIATRIAGTLVHPKIVFA